MKVLRSILLGIILTLWLGPSVCRAEVLTNETVVTMVKAGLGEELIISKLKTSQTQFDLSTPSLVKLKSEGVSEKIIQVMIETSTQSGTPEPKGPPVVTVNPMASFLGVSAVAITNSSSLFVKLRDRVAEMLPIPAQAQQSMAKHFIPFYFGPGDTWYFIRGAKSSIRVTEKSPSFYTKINPSSFFLVKLLYQSERDIRYVIATGTAFRNTVPLTVNKKTEDIFELVPKNDLGPGEYAFMASGIFYDFGIE